VIAMLQKSVNRRKNKLVEYDGRRRFIVLQQPKRYIAGEY
jgi:hypothetical protein